VRRSQRGRRRIIANCRSSKIRPRAPAHCRPPPQLQWPRPRRQGTTRVAYDRHRALRPCRVGAGPLRARWLRAWFVAGKPRSDMPNFGSFEAWSGVIRSVCLWLGMPDPWADTKGGIREASAKGSRQARRQGEWRRTSLTRTRGRGHRCTRSWRTRWEPSVSSTTAR
jgi:hypothetical protein